MKHMKKLLALVIAAVMMTGMCLTAFADASNPGYTTTFEGTSAMAAMANNVFCGADMTYDGEETTVVVYTKLYSRQYVNSEGETVTATGWISALTLTYGEQDPVTMSQGAYKTTDDGESYPTQFSGVFEGDLTSASAVSFTAAVTIKAMGYTHPAQSGTLTLTKKTSS